MNILHTSDWHLGRTLYSKKERSDEHAAFLDWLIQIITNKAVDLLLIAGDVFDTASPNSTSQKMYYDFLIKVKNTGCKHVVIVGGNHDSPSFLNAPKDILAALHISVVGNATENIEDEMIVIKDNNEQAQVIICGVPFLRERDISRFAEGESYTDRSKRINENIKKHYAEIAERAEQIRKEVGRNIPIVATGHLSVAGGKRNEDDGVRETYIGSIEAVGSDVFPDTFDYVALGHYHIPSKIKEHIRYCGSPIPMGFGEAGQKKCVYLIHFDTERTIETIEIPVFQYIESVVGDKKFIAQRLKALQEADSSVWVEVIYKGDELFPDLTAWVHEQTTGTNIEVLKLQNRQHLTEVLTISDTDDALDDLNAFDVFDKLLNKAAISDEQKDELKISYKEIVDGFLIQE